MCERAEPINYRRPKGPLNDEAAAIISSVGNAVQRIDGTLEQRVRGTHGAKKIEVCAQCGAQLSRSRLSIRDMILVAVFGSLSLSIFFPAGWMVVQWVDQQSRKIIDRMVWREPVDSAWYGVSPSTVGSNRRISCRPHSGYSERRARMGSTLAARRAGTTFAIRPALIIPRTTAPKT